MPIDSEKLFTLQRRQYEVVKRIHTGGLSIDDALVGIQGVIEGIYPVKSFSPPYWWFSYDVQTEKVQSLLDRFKCALVIPKPPSNFCPKTPSEVPVLAVYFSADAHHTCVGVQWTLDAWWDLVEAPNGYAKSIGEEFTSDPKHLQNVDGTTRPNGVRWIAVNSNANVGRSVKACWEDRMVASRLAGPEVMMMAAHFPDWITSWDGRDWLSPNLAGYQFRVVTDPLANPKAGAPYLCRSDEEKLLKLGIAKAEVVSSQFASPTVRDLAFVA